MRNGNRLVNGNGADSDSLESLAHADQLDPLDVEGILPLRSMSERCAECILEAQNEILSAKERTATRNSKR